MKRLIDNIFNPNRYLLILYGIFSFVFLIAYVWKFSFKWEYFMSVTFYVVGLLLAILLGLVITIKVDKKYDSRLKSYFVIALAQLLIIWAIANPIRTWQIDSSIEKAQLIINPLETYKQEFGVYPATLLELRKKLNLDIPRRTNIGTHYWYEKDEREYYSLSFLSYYGYVAHFNNEQGEWVITD